MIFQNSKFELFYCKLCFGLFASDIKCREQSSVSIREQTAKPTSELWFVYWKQQFSIMFEGRVYQLRRYKFYRSNKIYKIHLEVMEMDCKIKLLLKLKS